MIARPVGPEVIRFPTAHFGLAPIAGLQMHAPYVQIGDLTLVRCNRAEWERAERAYLIKDWYSQYYEANPVFLYRGYDEPLGARDIPRVFAEMDLATRRLVTALRLFKPGRLLEPAYTVRFVVAGGLVARQTGPYRAEYLAMPVDGLTWNLAEGEADRIVRLVAVVAATESTPGSGMLSAVVDQFNLSHTPLVSAALAVHLLLTATAMVFDGDGPGGATLTTTMYQRALAILQWAIADVVDAEWETFFADTVLPLRHAVHHHALSRIDVDLAEARGRLTAPLRYGIQLLMHLHLTRADSDATPRQTLNAALDRFVAGDRSALDALLATS